MEPPSPTAPGIVDADRPCLRCGYNLRNLAVEGVCPECGAPVARSLRGNLLEFSDRAYVADLRRGCTLVEIGLVADMLGGLAVIVLTVVLLVRQGSIISGSPAPPSLGSLSMEQFGRMVDAVSSLIAIFGWWLITTPDPGIVGPDMDVRARRVLRVLLVVSAASAAASLGITFIPGMGSKAFSIVGLGNSSFSPALLAATIVGLTTVLVRAASFFAKILYLKHLAARIPDGSLLSVCKVYIWLIPLLSTVGYALFCIGPLIANVLFLMHVNRYRTELGRILARMEPPAPA